ncbi:MAG TPA: TIM barrel protein [Flavitalea sp.]|nr:TIM barrel protein [Flavitalea sp.]
MNRRDFLELSGSASAAMVIPASIKLNPYMNQFQVRILATDWGYPGTTDQYLTEAKKAGYDGIEIWWPKEKDAQAELFRLLKKHGMEVGFLCGAYSKDFKEHLDIFKKMTDEAATNTSQKPLYINCHSGRDHFSFSQNQQFIDHTTALSKRTGVRICHETHRSRILYSAPVAREFMEKNPELKITLDISHWCNVHESMLDDQPDNIKLALSRAEHIHARVGHPEGPQVNDPRAPEWKEVLEMHLSWWDQIINRKKQANEPITILTEFGPPDYMPTLAYTRQPVADQWAINVYMLQLLRKRYS